MKTRAILLQASGQEHLCVEPGSRTTATLKEMDRFGDCIQHIHVTDYVKAIHKHHEAGLSNGVLQGLGLKMCRQGVNDRLNVAVEKRLQVVESEADTVIRNPALGEIICPDPFAAIAASHLGL